MIFCCRRCLAFTVATVIPSPTLILTFAPLTWACPDADMDNAKQRGMINIFYITIYHLVK